MQFLHLPHAGESRLVLEGEAFHYLCKVRRIRAQETLRARNLRDDYLYEYRVEAIGRREATLTLVQSLERRVVPRRFFHLIWAVVDSKSIEKALPMLNELGVGKISFFYARYSQRDVKIDQARLERILIHSCEQSGRSALPEVEVLKNLDEVLARYEAFGVLDFGGEILGAGACERLMVGPEGGFSEEERERLARMKRYSTGEELILRSESAAAWAVARFW